MTSNYIRFQYDAEDPNAPSKGQIRTIVEDKKGHLWVGYLDEGLDQFRWDKQKQSLVKLQHIGYDPSQKNGLLSNRVIQVLPDSEGFLWIGHNGAGLNKLDPQSGKMESYLHDPNNPSRKQADTTTTITRRSGNHKSGPIVACAGMIPSIY